MSDAEQSTGNKLSLFGRYSTPERVRARFNTTFQVRNCLEYSRKAKISPDDLEKYAAQFPEEGDKIQRMRNVSKFTGVGTALGLAASTVQMVRWTKTVPLIMTGMFVSTVAAHVVSDDIAGWIYGTYKFDVGAANERFHRWVYETKKDKQLEQQQA